MKIVDQPWAQNWRADEAATFTEAALKKTGNKLAAVVASNDQTAGGAIGVLEKNGLAGKVLVSGQDAELDAVRRIVAGTQAMTVYKPLDALARMAADAAVRLAKGEAVDAGDEGQQRQAGRAGAAARSDCVRQEQPRRPAHQRRLPHARSHLRSRGQRHPTSLDPSPSPSSTPASAPGVRRSDVPESIYTSHRLGFGRACTCPWAAGVLPVLRHPTDF